MKLEWVKSLQYNDEEDFFKSKEYQIMLAKKQYFKIMRYSEYVSIEIYEKNDYK